METFSAYRYDFAPITRSETTEEGYLRVWCRAARTGTQLYRRADGSQVREYRPPEEVSSPDSLSTFGMKPATWGHPPVLLDSANTKQYQVGYSGSQVRYNDGFVEVALVVTDDDAIQRIKRREATEVSAGYKVDFDPTPGVTPDGEDYAGVQRNIRVNHIAIVPRGRAGPEVRLLLDRMDAADAVAIDQELARSLGSRQPRSPESPVMSTATVKLDGLEIDLPAETATAVQSFARDMKRQLKNAVAERDDLAARVDALQAEVESLTYAKEAAEGRADALEEQVGAGDAGGISTPELDQLVMRRLSTLQHLAPAFEEDFHFDGIDDEDLYLQAYTNLTGQEPSQDADPTYIAGVVDGLLTHLDAEEPDNKSSKKKGSKNQGPDEEDEDDDDAEDTPEGEQNDRADSTDSLRRALGGVTQAGGDPVVTYRARQAEAWKRPLTATK